MRKVISDAVLIERERTRQAQWKMARDVGLAVVTNPIIDLVAAELILDYGQRTGLVSVFEKTTLMAALVTGAVVGQVGKSGIIGQFSDAFGSGNDAIDSVVKLAPLLAAGA